MAQSDKADDGDSDRKPVVRWQELTAEAYVEWLRAQIVFAVLEARSIGLQPRWG